MIKYKIIQKFQDRGITSTQMKELKIISQGTWTAITRNENITTKSINACCEYLKCQPGELLEWIPNEKGGTENE